MGYGSVPARRRARVRATVALPLIGLVLILIGGLAMPWFGLDQAGRIPAGNGSAWGLAAFVASQLVVLVPAMLVAFAGTLDSPV